MVLGKNLLRVFVLGVLSYLAFSPTLFQIVPVSRALGGVFATLETTPTLNPPDAADDPAIWIHPTDPSLSTIIGTDKKGYLEVYDMSGTVLQRIAFEPNNVDVRYNFPFGGAKIALVTGVNTTTHRLFAYRVNLETRLLEEIPTTTRVIGLVGSAMYVSPVTGKYYAFTNNQNVLKQYELSDNGVGGINVVLVRSITFGALLGPTEGVVADDVHGVVYASDEAKAIWKFGAEPGDGDTKVLVDKPIAEGGHFLPDIEGLTIYYKSDGTGYLIGSSQENSTYTVYKREGNNEFIDTFSINEGIIDEVKGTDGIDVTNFPINSDFPNGFFIAQDGRNFDNGTLNNQNFKLVPFESIASALGLTMDTTWDPRLVGGGPLPSPLPSPSPSVEPSPSPSPEASLEPSSYPSVAPFPSPSAEPSPQPSPSLEPSPAPSPLPIILTLMPTDDAYVNANAVTRNFGLATTLQADASPIKNVYFKFSVSGTSGKTISNARLRLYVTEASKQGGNLYGVPDLSWTEATIKYNNAPASSGIPLATLAAVALNNWYELDVTPYITGDGVYSLVLKSTSGDGVSYASAENLVNQPQLVVTAY